MTNSDTTHAQQQNWNAVAREWSKHFDWYAAAFQPVVEWCCDAIALVPSMRVLDIASGTGMPALEIASRIAPSGSVMATDISPEMLHTLSQRAHSMRLRNIEFRQMDAQSLDLPDHSVDAVTCVFGLMFCTEPARVLSEIHRVLRPGGRVAIATWAPPAENSFITAYGRAVADVLSLPRYDRSAPGPFRFTQGEELETLFNDAGFADVTAQKRPQAVEYASLDDYLATSQTLTPGLTDQLRALSEGQRAQLRELVSANVMPFIHGDSVHLQATPICASARV